MSPPSIRTALLVASAALFAWMTDHGAVCAQPGQPFAPPSSVPPRAHWAFQPVVRPVVPSVQAQHRVRTPVDALVLDRLERHGLGFADPASKRDLLRRAKFDLVGLPPTPEELEQFLDDTSADAYERMIDRWLESPQYGEAWGRHWLDLVRYADTAGFNADPARPLAYKYRDYVIRAFNSDMPYDRFIQEQIAGDELYPDDPEAITGTGYNRLWPDESNASNILLARQDALNDLTANVGSVFLGLSLGCAQCHDHKFDPILQTDFYQLQAFFAGIVPRDRVAVGTSEQLVEYQKQLESWLDESEAVRSELHQIERSAKVQASQERRMKFPPVVLEAIDTLVEHRTALQQQLVFWSERQIEVTEKQLLAVLSEADQKRRLELRGRVDELNRRKPAPPLELQAMVALEVAGELPATHLLAGGSYDKPVRELQPGFLSVLQGRCESPASLVPVRPGTSGRRTALARWLSHPENPLTARVMVNRIWQGHFGRGLVENANDFGAQTEPPAHPELLDWLAAEFVAGGWSIKSMHRLIMNSEVYRQSSGRGKSGSAEPMVADHARFAYYPRRRLSAESTRDALLAVAGQLELQMFGPGVRPDLPPGYSVREAWEVTREEPQKNRRSIYVFAKRNLPYPLLDAFDLPDMHESCARRAVTTTAPQALMLLNSELVLGLARAFADRLLVPDPDAKLPALVHQAYQLAFLRDPTANEIEAAVRFMSQQQLLIARRMQAGEAVAIPRGWPKFSDPARAAAVGDFCHALLNANEFVYID